MNMLPHSSIIDLPSPLSLKTVLFANSLVFVVTTIFNPAPAQSWLDTVFYKDSDVFCANETEVKLFFNLFPMQINDS